MKSMKLIRALPAVVLLLYVCIMPALACGQTPPAPTPDIVFPVDPAPTPTPPVTGPLPLAADQSYIFESSVPCLVLTSPPATLVVEMATGPMKFRGKAWPSDKIANVSYKGANLYFVTVASSAKAGAKAELIVSPQGNTDATKVIRKCFIVGQAPAPEPQPDPTPTPPMPTDPIVAQFTAALKADGQPVSTAATLAALYRQVAKPSSDTAANTVNDPSVTNYLQLFTMLKGMQDKLVDPAKIPTLRQAIGQQFQAALGSASTAIDRTAAMNVLNLVASKLEAVK